MENEDLKKLGEIGEEYGSTTGRKRITNWLNLDKLIKAINISGTNTIILSKADVIQKVNIYKFYYNNELLSFKSYNEFKNNIYYFIKNNCKICNNIYFSDNPFSI